MEKLGISAGGEWHRKGNFCLSSVRAECRFAIKFRQRCEDFSKKNWKEYKATRVTWSYPEKWVGEELGLDDWIIVYMTG